MRKIIYSNACIFNSMAGFFSCYYSRQISRKCFIFKRYFFSQTGNWPSSFSNDNTFEKIRFNVEKFWGPKLLIHDKMKSESSIAIDKKFYVLSMFPYPSGKLHMGHVRVYTISDAIARFHRLCGKDVIHPIGWDAFGLPAENAARENNVEPSKWTQSNIQKMKTQLKDFNISFDWNREVCTCSSEYFHWTQWLFLKLYQKNLVYRKSAFVNWDPVDLTVLADEQVDENGRSWRSNALVEKKLLRQWYIRTTAYAESLYNSLSELNPLLWKDIIDLQKAWIGYPDGTQLSFNILDSANNLVDNIMIFTRHPHWCHNFEYIAVKPEHILCNKIQLEPNLSSQRLPFLAKNPYNQRSLPMFVVKDELYYENFTNSLIGIPALHDYHTKLAAELNLDLPENFIQPVIKFDESLQIARNGKFGGYKSSAKLKDWLISRQRSWGTPIPIIHCVDCGVVPVPISELPVMRPLLSANLINTTYESQNKQTVCPSCGGLDAHYETDTMDTFVDSSWYFLRYLDASNSVSPFNTEKVNPLMPVDIYIGGKEHAVLHLYYARFFCHFLHDIGLINFREPFRDLLTQGMVNARTYKIKSSGRYVPPSKVTFNGECPVFSNTNEPVTVSWEKMSKSKFNGIEPQEVLEKHGVDATRLCILSNSAPKSDRNWTDDVFDGVFNWQRRTWLLLGDFIKFRNEYKNTDLDDELYGVMDDEISNKRDQTVVLVTSCFEYSFLLNAMISRLHELTNLLKKAQPIVIGRSDTFAKALGDLIIMMAPLAPCFAAELWAGYSSVLEEKHDQPSFVLNQKWPIVSHETKVPIFVSSYGKFMLKFFVTKHELEQLNADHIFQRMLKEKVAGRLVKKRKDFIKKILTTKSTYKYTKFNTCASLNVDIK